MSVKLLLPYQIYASQLSPPREHCLMTVEEEEEEEQNALLLLF